MAVGDLVTDASYNARLEGNQSIHVERLLQSDPEDWPPLLVTPWEEGRYLVLDGNHRLAAARSLGLPSLKCVVSEDAGYPEAFEANRLHGLPLTLADRKAYAEWLAENEPGLSHREIGRRAGLHHTTIARILASDGGNEALGGPLAASKPRQPVAGHLVRLLLKAADAGEGIGVFGRDKRAALLTNVISEYQEVDQEAVAKALHDWGSAMLEAAEPFLDPP